MKKIWLTICLITGFLLGGCSSHPEPILKGTYQSHSQGLEYVVQMAFQPDDNSFVEYIDNREVDRGTYERSENNTYKIKSATQNFDITLNPDDTFDISIDKINNGNSIQLNKIDDTPTYISTEFNDVEKYKELLH